MDQEEQKRIDAENQRELEVQNVVGVEAKDQSELETGTERNIDR